MQSGDKGEQGVREFVIADAGKGQGIGDKQKQFSGMIDQTKQCTEQSGDKQIDQKSGERDRNDDPKRDQCAVF